MSDNVPPNTDETAQALWEMAGQGATMGEMLEMAHARGGIIHVLAAFIHAFDMALGDVRYVVERWQGRGGRCSSEELEREHGERVRASRRSHPRRTRWTAEPGGGWSGMSDDETK